MSTLGNRARRLQANILQPLERLRSEIQFELTALQLQKEPWTDMVNNSTFFLKKNNQKTKIHACVCVFCFYHCRLTRVSTI